LASENLILEEINQEIFIRRGCYWCPWEKTNPFYKEEENNWGSSKNVPNVANGSVTVQGIKINGINLSFICTSVPTFGSYVCLLGRI